MSEMLKKHVQAMSEICFRQMWRFDNEMIYFK